MYSKRPCAICKKWFYPHPRVGNRQRVCSEPSCQSERQKRNQKRWRMKNPDYDEGRRLQKQLSQVPAKPLDIIRHWPRLAQIPWDIVQEEILKQPLEIIKYLGLVHRKILREEIVRYLMDNINGNGPHGDKEVQQEIALIKKDIQDGGQDLGGNHEKTGAHMSTPASTS